MSGIITLALLAILCAFIVGRMRRRFRFPVTGSTYVAVIVIFVIVVLALWGQSMK